MASVTRTDKFADVSASLAQINDTQLDRLLDDAPVIAAGIGGSAVKLEIAGVPVFAKRIRLTDLDARAENRLSTANLFQLPTYCQYGVGSPSFGAWREVAANTITTNWVLAKQCESFPLMYHWRVLSDHSALLPVSDELADVARAVAYWGGSQAVRERIVALQASTASVVIFLEYIPQNLHDWLLAQAALGDAAIESACAFVAHHLSADVSFMNAHGLMHFDAHFRNILTDGQQLYFADLGLATSRQFELSATEIEFLERNARHDECYAVTQLVNWLVTNLCGVVNTVDTTGLRTPEARNEFIRQCANGTEPIGIQKWIADIITRDAPIVVVMNSFYWKLHAENRETPFPVEEIERKHVRSRLGFAKY
jgi:hypothetical protein